MGANRLTDIYVRLSRVASFADWVVPVKYGINKVAKCHCLSCGLYELCHYTRIKLLCYYKND